MWVFPKNRDTGKSSNLIGFSIINYPFWGTPLFSETSKCSPKRRDGSKDNDLKGINFPETNSSPPENRPLGKGEFLLETTISRGELLVLRSVLLGKSTTQPCFVTEITVKRPNYPKLTWKVCCMLTCFQLFGMDFFHDFRFPMFTRCLTRGFYPESLQVVFVVNAPMVFVAFLGVFTSWRSSGEGNTTSSVIYHLKHLVHLGRLMAGTYTHHP